MCKLFQLHQIRCRSINVMVKNEMLTNNALQLAFGENFQKTQRFPTDSLLHVLHGSYVFSI